MEKRSEQKIKQSTDVGVIHVVDKPKLSESQIRFMEIEKYLEKHSSKRSLKELSNITPEERKSLAFQVRNLYTRGKKEADKDIRLKIMARFYDCLTLLLCDPVERKMAYCPPDEVEEVVFNRQDDCLCFGTGTTGERIYFETEDNQQTKGVIPGRYRYMTYYYPSDSAGELGRKYFKRFNEAFETNKINLDQLVLEDL
jgi:hypothetical protein